ncbi:hypothetical protein NLX83_30590 [Allokutzneria sp. A3M-2-11 16]|uniref:hypothetical protein n=1 Tax=Allokutzneria sp. A3M-2-11 16 TaxID=2962043 RepID=UPI0020B6DDAA|nr:hypothetical protein [Allokutzneria sp. A3M-2-11 16]MCP3803629.1 hypothetical protein [Allokutzneria sp. A3M-2-11 16]
MTRVIRWDRAPRGPRPTSPRRGIASCHRAVAVRLTEAGHNLIEPTVRQLLEHEADLIGTLTAAERETLTSILARLEQALVSGS